MPWFEAIGKIESSEFVLVDGVCKEGRQHQLFESVLKDKRPYLYKLWEASGKKVVSKFGVGRNINNKTKVRHSCVNRGIGLPRFQKGD